ncbi:hypothetical protein [Endozoicomonas atrinae]|uniref:hypothetical protein n=1 Tax=Endozoicomonas atrinae TaxID=1333660 RepID=UPI003B00C192
MNKLTADEILRNQEAHALLMDIYRLADEMTDQIEQDELVVDKVTNARISIARFELECVQEIFYRCAFW